MKKNTYVCVYIYILYIIYIYITESLCCIPETFTNQLYFNLKKMFEKRDLVLLKCGLAHPQALPPPTFMVPWLSHPRLGVGTKDHCLPIWGHEGLVLFVDAVINLVLDWETVIGVFLFFNILLKYRWFAMLC